jgi:hypothetical protein
MPGWRRHRPRALLKRHMARVVHVHCKDVRTPVIAQARNDGWSFLTGVLNGTFTVPGDGSIDYEAVLSTLHRPVTRAGWWSRPSRTRPWHPATPMRRRATTPACLVIVAKELTWSAICLAKARPKGREIVERHAAACRLGPCRVSRRAPGRGEVGNRRPPARANCAWWFWPAPLTSRRWQRTLCEPGHRDSVFDDRAPDAVYVPPGCRSQLRFARGRRDSEVALCTAPGDGSPVPCAVLDPASMRAACAARAPTRATCATSCRTTTRRPRICWWWRC